MNAENRNLKKV